MNQVLKIKYKIFHLINIFFYLIFFVIGFFVGGGKIEKISDIFKFIN